MTRHVARALILLTGLIAVFSPVIGCSRSSNTGPVVLGHLGRPGNQDEINGVALAAEAINADPAKQIGGRKLKVIHADAGDTPDAAQGQAARLLTVDKVEGLIGPSRWAQAEKVALANQSPPTIVVSPSGYAGAYLFPVGISPSEQGKALGLYAKEDLKAGRAVIIKQSDSEFGAAVARAFADQFGGSPAEHAVKAGDALDFLKDGGKTDVILLCGTAAQVNAWRAKAPAGARVLFGGEETDFASLTHESDPARAVVAALSFHPADETASAKEFVRRYQEKYGKPPTTAAALAYDAVNVWAGAARRANSADPDKVREQLAKKDATFEVLTGSLTYGGGQGARRPVFVVQLTSDGGKLIRRLGS